MLAGDWNRHDQLWGGDRVGCSPRQGEAAPIIDMMAQFNLQNLLPRGTTIFIGPQGTSTIDVAFASQELYDRRTTTQIHFTNMDRITKPSSLLLTIRLGSHQG